jgi:hypothetical protein
MSTINNISLRTIGERHLERAQWCIPLYVSLMTSITIFSGFYFGATFLQTFTASICAVGVGFWFGFGEKLSLQERAFLILAQSDLHHLLEVKTIKPETEESKSPKSSVSQTSADVKTEEKITLPVEAVPEKLVTEVKKSSTGFKGRRKKQTQQPPQATASKKNR